MGIQRVFGRALPSPNVKGQPSYALVGYYHSWTNRTESFSRGGLSMSLYPFTCSGETLVTPHVARLLSQERLGLDTFCVEFDIRIVALTPAFCRADQGGPLCVTRRWHHGHGLRTPFRERICSGHRLLCLCVTPFWSHGASRLHSDLPQHSGNLVTSSQKGLVLRP